MLLICVMIVVEPIHFKCEMRANPASERLFDMRSSFSFFLYANKETWNAYQYCQTCLCAVNLILGSIRQAGCAGGGAGREGAAAAPAKALPPALLKRLQARGIAAAASAAPAAQSAVLAGTAAAPAAPAPLPSGAPRHVLASWLCDAASRC